MVVQIAKYQSWKALINLTFISVDSDNKEIITKEEVGSTFTETSSQDPKNTGTPTQQSCKNGRMLQTCK